MQNIDSYELYNIRFASLLHDIGKFWQGAGGGGKHEKLSRDFVLKYLPPELQEGLTFIAGHHDSSQYLGEERYPLKIIVLADWLASSERKELDEDEERGKRKTKPMESIFVNISLDGKNDENKDGKYYNIALLSPDGGVFPTERENIPEDLEGDYKNLWNKFLEELKNIKYNDKESYFIILYYLLKKYTSHIPSAVWQSRSDISLFDHSKMTCAIAECIYKNKMDEKEIGDILKSLIKKKEKKDLTDEERNPLNQTRFSLIGGDISGIQKFIYSITAKGAAKGLKGRSFYLQLLGEAIAKYILRRLDLSIANLIYSAGGHFYIIAPKNINIDKIRKELEEILMEIHNGELYVAIDKVDMSINDLIEKRIGEKWKELGEKLGERKKKKFSHVLDRNFFYPNIDSRNTCQVCGLPSKYGLIDDEGIQKCVLCKSFEELSEKIAGKDRIKANYLIECKPDGNEKEGTWEWNLSKFGVKYEIVEGVKNVKCDEGTIYRINSEDFILQFDGKFSYGFRYMFQTPLKELEDLAKAAEGIKRWGVMRGDVDNLGRIFSEGLKGENRTLSRVSTLSTYLSFFFDAYMNEICREFDGKIYGLYAGGDDFFIIGSWDILPDLASKIYQNFRKYTAWNPNITLSIGISIAPSEKYPIYKIAEIVGEELDKAKGIKEYYEEIGLGTKIEKDKDSLSFLGIPVKWEAYPSLEYFRNNLMKFLKKAPHGILQKFYSIYELYKRARKKSGGILAKYDNRYGRWRWMLAYVISRMKVEGKEKLKQLMIDNIDYSPIVIKWVEYLTRGEKNE